MDPQPDPTDSDDQPDHDGDPSDAAPAEEDEADAGAAPTEPAAQGDHAHSDDLIGDWADSDIDLSALVPTDDGEPDDDEEPTP